MSFCVLCFSPPTNRLGGGFLDRILDDLAEVGGVGASGGGDQGELLSRSSAVAAWAANSKNKQRAPSVDFGRREKTAGGHGGAALV